MERCYALLLTVSKRVFLFRFLFVSSLCSFRLRLRPVLCCHLMSIDLCHAE